MLGNQIHHGFDHFKIEGRRPVGRCSQSPFNSWRDELQNYDREICFYRKIGN